MWSFFSRPAAAEPIEAVGRVLDGLFTSDKERLSKTAALAREAQKPALVQAEINKIEAAHRSVFVSGGLYRWVCGLRWPIHCPARYLDLVHRLYRPDIAVPPAIHMEELITVLMGCWVWEAAHI